MVNIEFFIINLKKYLQLEISRFASSTPLVSFMSPLISRAVNNAVDKISQPLTLIADKEGNIDISNILEEIKSNLINTSTFTVDVPIIGPLFIGDGSIRINIPYTEHSLMLTLNDLDNLKEVLTKKD